MDPAFQQLREENEELHRAIAALEKYLDTA